ncbi:MAG: helix-turn-helix domain-containing protein, partial [Coprococcus sp.]
EYVEYLEINKRIQELRTQRGMTQLELSQLLGTSKSVISSYENALHLPPYDILLKLSDIFGVTTDYLLGNSSQRTLSVDGLTETQVQSVQTIIEELRQINK